MDSYLQHAQIENFTLKQSMSYIALLKQNKIIAIVMHYVWSHHFGNVILKVETTVNQACCVLDNSNVI
jgi:hypothetical protein